jgi:hypothetical protein
LKLRDLDQNVSKYFQSMVQDTVNYREKNGVKRNDFMQLLIQIKNKGKVEEGRRNTEQNGHGIVEDKSGKSGMYSMRQIAFHCYIINFRCLYMTLAAPDMYDYICTV